MTHRWVLAALAVLASVTHAQVSFIVPSLRGGPDTTYQAWNIFTTEQGLNNPDVANSNPNGTATLQVLTEGNFITSGGNISNTVLTPEFEVKIPDFNFLPAFIIDAVVQVKTLGNLPDLSSFLLNGVAPVSVTETFSQSLGPPGVGGGGFLKEYRVEFNDVLGSGAITTLTFKGAESSVYLDRLVVDTQSVAVPEIGSIALSMIGGTIICGMWVGRRRLRKEG